MADPGGLGRALGVLAGDPAVDGVVVVVGDHPPRLSELLADGIAAAAGDLDGRVVAQWSAGSLSEPGMTRLARAGIPVFTSPERCMRAVARAMRADVAPPPPAGGEGALPPGPLRESEAKLLLEERGIPSPRRAVAADPAGVPAAVAAAGLAGAVVVKADCRGAVHKAAAGAVRTGVPAGEAGPAAAEAWAAARAAFGAERVGGVIVEELVAPLAELVLAVHRDPNAGPVITVGAGGALVEAARDAVSRLAPVDEEEAARMIDALRMAPLLAGGSGRPAADRAALARAVAALSALGPLLGDGVELVEVNPLAAMPEGVLALDAVVEGPA